MPDANTPTMLDEAKSYSSLGLTVIPVGTDKKPLIPWKLYQTERPKPEDLAAWFSNGQAQIGVLTGALSSVVVIDIEATALDQTDQFPYTAMSGTGGGGVHLWYRHPGRTVPNAVRFRPGMDIRGDGGYVVAPPSLHQSGRHYRWLVPLDHIAPFPSELLEEIGRHRNASGTLTQIIQGVPDGQRDVSATQIIGSLLAHYSQKDWEVVCWPLIQAWNTKNNPPLSQEQLRKCWESIARRETRKPDRQTIETPAHSASPRIATVDPFSEPASNLLDEPDEPVDWLIEPLIERESLGFIGGEPKQTKSILALHLAFCGATGQPFIGQFNVLKPLKVLYVQEEDSRRMVKRRLKAFVRASGDRPSPGFEDRLRVAIRRGFRIDEPDWFRRIQAELDDFKPDLVIFDVLANLHGLDENDQRDMSQLIKQFQELRDTYHCAVLIVHHFKKTSREGGFIQPNQRLRGSSVLAASSENSFYLSSQPDKLIRLDHESKDGPVEPFVYAIEGSWPSEDGVRIVHRGEAGAAAKLAKADAFYAQLCHQFDTVHEEGCTVTALSKALGMSKNTVRSLIKLLLAQRRVQEGEVMVAGKDEKQRKTPCFLPILSESSTGEDVEE